MKEHISPHLQTGLRYLYTLALLVGVLLFTACARATTSSSPSISPPATHTATLLDVVPDIFYENPLRADPQSVSTALKTQESPQTPEPSELSAPTLQATMRPTLAADEWMSLPVIPNIGDTTRAIFQEGISLGRDPHAFSKVGDCQVATDFFLASFDKPNAYNLGSYGTLQKTINWFAGSFSRHSEAMRDAMRAEALFSSLYADAKDCLPGEGPLACEYRLHNPSIAIISLEQTWSRNVDLEKYTRYLRQAIEYTISQGIIPILATKADNVEGEHQINRIIAQLAREYDIPLWNFWAAVQPIPYQGLIANTPDGKQDMYHLTAGRYYDLSLDDKLLTGWIMRNLTALQALDAVWRGVSEP